MPSKNGKRPQSMRNGNPFGKKKDKKTDKLGPIDMNSPRYSIEYNHDLPPPSSLEDYHWVCYHYRSGQKYSCHYGNECRWRHYDFEMRTDIKTAWSAETAKKAKKPTLRDMTEARQLRTSIEAQFPYLTKKKQSMNPTLPSMNQLRAENVSEEIEEKQRLEEEHGKERDEENKEESVRFFTHKFE